MKKLLLFPQEKPKIGNQVKFAFNCGYQQALDDAKEMIFNAYVFITP